MSFNIFFSIFQYSISSEDGGRDPSQHPCLQALPTIFLKAMKGIAAHVDAFLGMYKLCVVIMGRFFDYFYLTIFCILGSVIFVCINTYFWFYFG